MTHKHFVLEAIDTATECVELKVVFEVASVDELCEQVGLERGQFDPRVAYELDKSDLDRIRDRLEVQFQPGDRPVLLRQARPIDALPYLVHTNRELAMMLAGTKPLAAFMEEYPSDPDCDVIPERLFEPYVTAGRFIKREAIISSARYAEAGSNEKYRRVLYAVPGEQWRIDAYLLLHEIGDRNGWNEGFERMEGSLLGYEQWQNDVYIEMIYRSGIFSRRPNGPAGC